MHRTSDVCPARIRPTETSITHHASVPASRAEQQGGSGLGLQKGQLVGLWHEGAMARSVCSDVSRTSRGDGGAGRSMYIDGLDYSWSKPQSQADWIGLTSRHPKRQAMASAQALCKSILLIRSHGCALQSLSTWRKQAA